MNTWSQELYGFAKIAVGRDLLKCNEMVTVIKDEAMTTRQAYKTMNNSRHLEFNMIIIPNYNKHVSHIYHPRQKIL